MAKSSIKFLDNIAQRSSHRLLAASFFPLHFSIYSQDNPLLAKMLFLVHIGMFLLWQPFVSHRTQIHPRPTIIAVLAILGIVYLAGGWAQMIWIVLLIGIISSYRLGSFRDQLIFLLIAGFLLTELFGVLLPLTLLGKGQLPVDPEVIYYMPLSLNIAALVLPAKTGSFRNYSSDLLYSLMAVAVVVVLAMSTLLGMAYSEYSYYLSLIYSMLILAGVLMVFNLIFQTSSEIGLLSQFTNRYALNLGTPFESFLLEAAELSEQTEDPEEYLQRAFASLQKLEWVRGFHWQSERDDGRTGEAAGHAYEFNFDSLTVKLHSYQLLRPAMHTHAKLLIKLVEIFYTAKRREISLAYTAHMEAIYETGARLTHDIKNLLQSLTLMLSGTGSRAMSAEDSKLFFRNLEIITQRLQQTLSKLRNPETLSEHTVSLDAWWTDVRNRETGNEYVHFSQQINEGIEVPEELFNGVLENLLDNAKKKRRRDPELQIHVEVLSDLDKLQLQVRDSGSPIPEPVAKTLLNGPVKSRSGFGIGLYQAAKQAAAHGFKLKLVDNQPGNVCFQLRKG